MADKDEDFLNTSIGEELSDEEGNEMNLSTASSASESGVERKKARTQTPSPHRQSPANSPRRAPPAFMVAASPPKFMSLEQVMEAANGVKNMALAHEIAVDSNFKLEKIEKPKNSIEKQMTDIMHKAFWDAFEERLQDDPPDYSHAVILIGEVKENLMKILLPQHVRLRTQICEVLDLDLIKQKLENDAFDIYYYSDYVVNIMAKLCAPVRDDNVAKLKEIKDIVPLFKEIFEVLDMMKMDMANFTIQQMRPYLQQQSVEYERKKFQEFLSTQQETGIDGLEFTKHWLKRSFDKLANSEDFCTKGASASPMATPAAIVNEAYMELLQWDNSQIFPETLVIDQGRFIDVRDKTDRLILVASILLVTYSTVGAAIQGVQSLKEKMKSEICTILEGVTDSELPDKSRNVAEQIHKTVDEYLQAHGFNGLDDEKHKLLIGQISQLFSKEHAVYKVMAKRLIDFIKQIISKKHTEPLKVPPGYSVVERELGQCCGQFLRLISHNRSVFFSYYSDIVNTLLQWKVGDLSPRD